METICQLQFAVTLPPGNELLKPFSRVMDGPQSRFGRCKEDKHFLFLPGFEPQTFYYIA